MSVYGAGGSLAEAADRVVLSPCSARAQPAPSSSLFPGPFCHRALLTLEEKRVGYTTTLIDFDNKPQWLLDVNPAGSVPVMKVGAHRHVGSYRLDQNAPVGVAAVADRCFAAAVQELATGEWIVDSGVIVDYLENKFPEPKLGTSQDPPQMCGAASRLMLYLCCRTDTASLRASLFCSV